MIKMNWVVLISLGLIAAPASAEETIVIDTQTLGGQTAPSGTEAPATTQPDAPAEPSAAAERERILKGRRVSPRQRTAVAKSALSDNNLQAGEDFLAANKTKPGVITLPSGVQYKILRAGNGPKPTQGNVLACRFRGTLIDGSEFEKTDAKKPAFLKVAGFVPGLNEAVKLMPAGSKWQIVVPPKLAYGEQGNRGVGPHAVVIYEMEIIGIR